MAFYTMQNHDVGAGIAWNPNSTRNTTRDYDDDLAVGVFCLISGTTLKNITKPLTTTEFIKGVVVDGCCGLKILNGLIKNDPRGIATTVIHGSVSVKVATGITLKMGEPLFIVVKAGADVGKVTNVEGTAGTDTVAVAKRPNIRAIMPLNDAWLVEIH